VQTPGDKPLVTFNPGLITEAGPLNTPDGATVDEQNFHLLIDGSRKRRRGLKLEEDGVVIEPRDFLENEVVKVGRWPNAGSIPDNDLIVVQMGTFLYFFEDSDTALSPNKLDLDLDLRAFASKSPSSVVGLSPVSFASGNGVLIVTGRYVNPFYVTWVPGTPDRIEVAQFQIKSRDFVGIDDGVPTDFLPTTLTDSHKYNLLNRGWIEEDITAYFTAEAKYPSKAMLWHKGYARQVDDAVYSTLDGQRKFHAAKLKAEPWPNSSAPQGSFVLDSFDTVNVSTATAGDLGITALVSAVETAPGYRLTFTTSAAHSLVPSDAVTLNGTQVRYRMYDIEHSPPLYEFFITQDLTGEYVAQTGTTGSTLVIDIPYTGDGRDTWSLVSGGTLTQGALFTRPDGYITNERPIASAWFAGRVWLAGTAHPKLADRVMFSQVVETTTEYGWMFQRNDPTNEELNQLIATDGGVIQLPDIGNIKGMLPYQSILLVLADNGIWEISSGRDAFAPDTVRARKITDVGCASTWGFVEAEGRVLFVGTTGLFAVQPDEETGILYAVSISMEKVQTEWSKVPTSRARYAKVAYDSVNKQAWFLFNRDPAAEPSVYTSALVYDLRLQAWSKFEFPSTGDSFIVAMVHVTEDCPVGEYRKLKFLVSTRGGSEPFVLASTLAGDYTAFGNVTPTYSDSGGGVPEYIILQGNFGGFVKNVEDPAIVGPGNMEYQFTMGPDPTGGTWTTRDPSTTYIGMLIGAAGVTAEFAQYPSFVYAPTGGVLVGIGGTGDWDSGPYNRLRLRSFSAAGAVVASTDVALDSPIADGSSATIDIRIQKVGGLFTVFVDDVEKVTDWDPGAYEDSSDDIAIASYEVNGSDGTVGFSNISVRSLVETEAEFIVADLQQSDYTDWTGTEESAYLLMGADPIGDWHRFRQAPIVHLFARRTETGFTGGGDAVNPASIKMRARWDWTDRIDTGKWGSEQQGYREEVYKHQRPYVPEDLDGEFDDGYPVVVTRNKVRGRGRALQLWFSTTAAHDAHILGYAIRYKVTRRV
jgi:hypothetical protein